MTSLTLPKPLRLHLPRVERREAAGAAVLGMAVMLAFGGVSAAMPYLPKLLDQPPAGSPADALTAQALPSLPATQIRALDPDDAIRVNAAIPLAGVAGASAAPFVFGKGSSSARANAITCLTSAIYYEAGQESADGQRAVAQVIINRVRHPAFPNSVCGVVYDGSTRSTGCQFTFTCDGSMARAPVPSLWDRARKIAEAALAGSVFAPVGYATHYHANYVVPYWASSQAKTAVIGAHLFYRWSGGWGQPGAFAQGYSGREPDPRGLRLATLSIVRVPRAPDGTLLATAGGPVVTKVAGTAVQIEPDGKRVRALFTPQARAAVEKVVHKPYVERAAASDNLRYTLGDAAPATSDVAFGTKPGAATEGATKAN